MIPQPYPIFAVERFCDNNLVESTSTIVYLVIGWVEVEEVNEMLPYLASLDCTHEATLPSSHSNFEFHMSYESAVKAIEKASEESH